MRTPRKREGREEWIIMERGGREISRVLLPEVPEAPYIAHMMGVKFYTIAGGRLFYHEATDGEARLHVVAIGDYIKNDGSMILTRNR